MNFFRRKDKTEQSCEPVENASTPTEAEVMKRLKQMARSEVRRQQAAAALLTPQKMSRIEEAKRLAQTKLRNTEQSLQRIHVQLDWLSRYKEKLHELEEHQVRLNQVNKRMATLATDEQELERFEAFENVQGLFQRMTLLGRMATRNKEERTQMATELSDAEHLASEHQRRLDQLQDDTKEALQNLIAMRDELEDVNRTLGAQVMLDIDEKWMAEMTANLNEQRDTLTAQCTEHEATAEMLNDEITRLGTERQSLEPYQKMAEHGDAVLVMLDRLLEMSNELEQMSHDQQELQNRQKNENDMLGRVFANYQQVDSDIRVLNDELYLHRQQNLGRSSYSLQERAMKLKSRRQMLISAQSLWNRISSGYAHIEEKTQRVNQLRLDIEQLKQQSEELRSKVVQMRKLVQEKEYTLTLSKSQNVIELRSDLQEGTPCTVCGASHHPYFSDTILEQSKLISELRTEYELQKGELTAKETQLREMEDKLVREQTCYEVEGETLSQLRHRQMEDVNEWGVFSSLDRTFKECSPSTNMDARTVMLRQLIEQTARDADDAQRELDEYNFHQTRINEISEELTRKEQQKNDLTVRLNEVNTGCQVMAGRVERLLKQRSEYQEKYTQLYENLSNIITLPEWFREWQVSHEGMRMKIEQMMSRWKNINQEINDKKHKREVAEAMLADKRGNIMYIDALLLLIRDKREQQNTLRKEGEQLLDRTLHGQSVKSYWDTHCQSYLEAKNAEDQQREVTHQALTQAAQDESMLKLLTEKGKNLDERTVEERSALDVWMRKFNANHPPVQYIELEHAFEGDKDWSKIRSEVRKTRIESMLEQSRVDQLRSTIVALQAEGHQVPKPDAEDPLESLVAQQKQLEKQHQEVLMQIAEIELTLRNHEECKERLKAEEDEMYDVFGKLNED